MKIDENKPIKSKELFDLEKLKLEAIQELDKKQQMLTLFKNTANERNQKSLIEKV